MVYIANGIGVLAAVVYVLSYQQKTRRMIALMGAVARLLFVAQYLLLGAFAGAVLDILGAAAALLAQKKDHPALKKYLPLIIAAVHISLLVACLVFYKSPIDIFALLGTSLHVGALWFSRERTIRRVSLAGSPCWLVYNVASKAYPSAVSDCFTICSLLVAMIRFDFRKNGKQPEENE